VEVRRHGAVGQDASCRGGDQAASEPSAAGGLLGDHGQLLAPPIVYLDADAGDHPTLVDGHQARTVERSEPFGKLVGLLLKPRAEIGDVGIDAIGRAEHARTERCGPDAENLAELVAEPVPVRVVADRRAHRIDGVWPHGDHRGVGGPHSLQLPDRAVPRRPESRRVTDDVDP
jgi:hypothetical protein